jgi:hypothetical protein
MTPSPSADSVGLKPCPFCGGPAKLTAHKVEPCVYCLACNFTMGASKVAAVERWNSRPSATSLASEAGDLSAERLAELFAQMLGDTYHCTRVWSAWGVGTMSEDDFEPAAEGDLPRELAEAVMQRLRSQRVGDQWQPIETAPKTVEILVGGGSFTHSSGNYPAWPMPNVAMVHWDTDEWRGIEDSDGAYYAYKPTHWQPLPAAPTSQPAEEARCGTCEGDGSVRNSYEEQRVVGEEWSECPDCHPAEAPATAPQSAGDEVRWMIYYHDVDRTPELFAGYGAGSAALQRFHALKMSWNVVLLREWTGTAPHGTGMTEALAERAARAIEHCATMPDTTAAGARLAAEGAATLRSIASREKTTITGDAQC